MTDEELAEGYLDPIHRMYSCNNEHYTDEVIERAYLDGLAEGRKENAELNQDKTELVNSVTELKIRVTELENQLKNNPYVQILQKEKSEMAEDFAKQIEKMKNKLNCSKYHYCLCKDKTCKDCKDWKMND